MPHTFTEFCIPGDPNNTTIYAMTRWDAITQFMRIGYKVTDARRCIPVQ